MSPHSISIPKAQASPSSGPVAHLVRRATHASTRRPKLTIALWLTLVIGCIVLGSSVGTRNLSDAASNVGQSAQAEAQLTRAGIEDPAVEDVLVRSRSARDTAVAVAALAMRARALHTIRAVETATQSRSLSHDGGRVQLLVVTLRGDPDDADTNVVDLEHAAAAVAARNPHATLLEAGDGSGDRATNQLVASGLHRAELISVPVTLLILVLAFGALMAASVPLLLGTTSVAAALGALGLVSRIAPNGSATGSVVALIGLAVGVDYSLFYIRRERTERAAGAGPRAALDATSATVGRAIVVAGATVAIGLAGLLLTGFGIFTSMALGAILVVLIAVVGSLTALPATLALLGDRIDRGRLWRRPVAEPSSHRGWERLANAVTGLPRTSLVVVVVALGGLALPVLGMHTATPGLDDMPAGTPVVVAARAIERAFPGTSDQAELVVTGDRLGRGEARQRLIDLGRAGEAMADGRGAVALRVAANGATALVEIPVSGRNLAVENRDVAVLRHRLGPATRRLLPGASAQLTGDDAESYDFSQRMAVATPLVIGVVLVLAFVLLLSTFGSARLALAVTALNLLSVGAAFGVMVGVFQYHWAQSLLGFTSDGAITNWLPLFSFVLLFGLSMDYTVLVLERAAEARRTGASPRAAATVALCATGSTVTSAAAVMVGAFSVLATLPLLEFKQMGVGLAAAVALDATFIRGIALPAVLALVGARRTRPARTPFRQSLRGWEHLSRVSGLEANHE